MDSAPQSEDLILSIETASSTVLPLVVTAFPAQIPSSLVEELWTSADAAACGLTRQEWGAALVALGERLNHGCPAHSRPDAGRVAAFYRALHLPEFALATACVLGREVAWQRFVRLFRTPLLQAAIAITGSASLGHDLAESLYAELYGLRERDGERYSPLATYSGRGSLLGWLRTTLAQRSVDHHRRTYRECPLDAVEPAAHPALEAASATGNQLLSEAVAVTLRSRSAEERFLLSAYYLDRQTLRQIGQTLHVHEATISRRLQSLTGKLRKQLLKTLQHVGLDKRAAQEALGTDPRDLEINLRGLLQTSQFYPFSVRAGPAAADTPPEAATSTAASDSV